MPLSVAEAPIDFPKMSFYLLWHDRSHYEEECRWFREQITTVARQSPALQHARDASQARDGTRSAASLSPAFAA